jgi:hypothetical protein
VNKSQENWPDAQLSLSTATPSLGGAPPKLTTLKIDYYHPHYDYDRLATLNDSSQESSMMYLRSAGLCESTSPALQSKKSKGFVSFRGRSSLSSKQILEDDQTTTNTVNVLSTTAEASMSSTSFTIPRRSTIDADVSLLLFSDSF